MRTLPIVHHVAAAAALCLGLAASFAAASPLTYSAPELTARFVDASGAPVADAIVYVRWPLDATMLGGGVHDFDSIYEYETVTDRDGRIVIPAWGPRPHAFNTTIARGAPELRLYRQGFDPLRLTGDARTNEERVNPAWNGTTITLVPTNPDLLRYTLLLNAAWRGDEFDCLRSCPRMALAISAEWQRLLPSLPRDPRNRGSSPPMLWERTAEDQRFLEQFSGAPIERPPTRVIRKHPNSSNTKPAAAGDSD